MYGQPQQFMQSVLIRVLITWVTPPTCFPNSHLHTQALAFTFKYYTSMYTLRERERERERGRKERMIRVNKRNHAHSHSYVHTHTHMWLTMILSTRDLKYNDMVSKPIKVPRSALQCVHRLHTLILTPTNNNPIPQHTHVYTYAGTIYTGQ